MRAITKAGATFNVADRDEYSAFWDWYETDDWEPETVAVFSRFLRPDTRYVDLGAWIGSTVLLAAPLVSRIVCVEPDPLAFAALSENLALNPEVMEKTTAVQAAVGATDGSVILTSAGAGGDSNSSVARAGDTGARWETEQVSIATLLLRAALGPPDFIKVDIEGAEYDLLSTLPVQPPTLYVALHPNLLIDKRSLAARISSSMRALRANRRFLRALLQYRHHYVYDEKKRELRDIRSRNVLRVLLPLPLRVSFLVGACVFTNEAL
jgi:FkbM family methyltransferase